MEGFEKLLMMTMKWGLCGKGKRWNHPNDLLLHNFFSALLLPKKKKRNVYISCWDKKNEWEEMEDGETSMRDVFWIDENYWRILRYLTKFNTFEYCLYSWTNFNFNFNILKSLLMARLGILGIHGKFYCMGHKKPLLQHVFCLKDAR